MKKEDIKKKRILKIGSFSVILPPGWISDQNNKETLELYREKLDSGVVQITVFSKFKNKQIDPEMALKDYLENSIIKITKNTRNNSIYAISDYYIKDGIFSRTMIVENSIKHAFITYNIEQEYKI